MAERRKLLLVSTRKFWPVDSGRKLSLFHYCRGLHEVYGYDIYVFAFLESGQSESDVTPVPAFIRQVRYAKRISKAEQLKNLIKSYFSQDSQPLQCSLYYSKANEIALSEYASEIDADAVMVDMIRLAPYFSAVSKIKGPKILDMDDILSKRYERHAERNDARANLAGTYSGNFTQITNRLLNLGFLKKTILRHEASLMKAAEMHYAGLYDSVVLVSEREVEYLKGIAGADKKIIAVPIGVDYEYFSQEVNITKIPDAISFVGALKVAANADSLAIIIEKIMPKLNEDVKLIVIGNCPDQVRKRYEALPNVTFTGRVDDLRAYVKATQVFVSPIAYGSGMKTKILEAMAMGVPVVTNSIGAEGLAVESGRELIIEETEQGIADAVTRLLACESDRKALAENGRRYVVDNHDWNMVFGAFKSIGL